MYLNFSGKQSIVSSVIYEIVRNSTDGIRPEGRRLVARSTAGGGLPEISSSARLIQEP